MRWAGFPRKTCSARCARICRKARACAASPCIVSTTIPPGATRGVCAGGRNWLVFGHRNYTHDFLYQLELQDWLQSRLLTRLDLAFSRDQPEKRYVQNALWDARSDLYRWLKDGAALYVCGDANAMAKDVHATLLRILADQGRQDEAAAKAELDAIRRDGRYLRDVY